MRRIVAIAWFLLLPGALYGQAPFRLAPVWPALQVERPVALIEVASGRRYVVEQAGRIVTFTGDGRDAALFVDLTDRVDDGPSEAGLLGMAPQPDFAGSGQVILSYTADGAPLTSVIARFTSHDGGRTLDPGSERRLLTLEQPFGNHNGGQVAFGPDGFLYIGLGDGGSGGDPHGNGQDPQTLLGTILRIDVLSGDEAYVVPPDNPFVAGGGRPEVYAFGLRNPWRWSFDRVTGRLWAGDVGQSRWEEIDVIEKGGNYGWAIREGAHCYRQARCREAGLIGPVAEYDHTRGCSVTGGYVYRGSAIPGLYGTYLYGDFCSGRIWGLDAETPGAVPRRLLDSGLRITSFAEDGAGELYVLDYGGAIHKLVPAQERATE